MKTKKSTDNRSRNFATVVYPESAPENWLEIVSSLCIPAFISPLHDSDFTAAGEPKKAHYHVMLMFEGKKSDEQVRSICEAFGGVGIEKLGSARGYARYLCHLDDPNKARYNPSDVLSFSGANYNYTIGLVADKYKCVKEMMEFCDANQVYVYADLLRFASIHNDEWYRVLCDNGSYIMKEFIKSTQWAFEHGLSPMDFSKMEESAK